jgi:hypothetical protein
VGRRPEPTPFEDGHLLAGESCERGKRLRWSRVEGAALGKPHPWRSPGAGLDMAVDYHDRTEDATAPRLRFNRWGGAALPLYADVAQNAEVTKLRVVERHLGPSHILINSCWRGSACRSACRRSKTFAEEDSDAVNLPATAAPAVLSKGASLRTHRNVSLLAGQATGRIGLDYAAAKARIDRPHAPPCQRRQTRHADGIRSPLRSR